MKTFLSILVIGGLLWGVWWWKENKGISAVVPEEAEAQEFCYFKEEGSPDSSFKDKFSLWMVIDDLEIDENRKKDNAKVTGELKLLPAEKDALVGSFMGLPDFMGEPGLFVGTWKTEGEGMTADQELEFSYNEKSAKIAFGEMVLDNISNRYVYKDRDNLTYIEIPAVDCADFNERSRVEAYLWGNIAKLSPVAPVLGGNWYVVSAQIDLESNSGSVVYEDGHVQEKRDFTYVIDESGRVSGMTLK